MTAEIRLGSWVCRPAGRGWVVGRQTGRRMTRRTYHDGRPRAVAALVAAIEREKGVRMPHHVLDALRATSEATGLQLSLVGIEPEVEIGRRALAGMEGEPLRAHYLELVRREMRRRGAGGGGVTPDMARKYFESLDPPPPEQLSRNFLGCVFRGREWQAVGTYPSETPGSHGNLLNIYSLRRSE